MKTFSDPNTLKEQERLNGAVFIIKIDLLRQHDGNIVSIDDMAKTINVSGDASGFITAKKYINIPLDDLQKDYEVQSVSYSASIDETTVYLNTSETLSDSLIGLQIARRYVVSYGDTERRTDDGLSPIRFTTEGDALNEFLADDVSFEFDNGDGFFSNKDLTGIFDSGQVMWVRIWTGYKNSSDRILYFSGIVDNDSLESDRANRTFRCTAYGHLKELERYPGYRICNTNGELVKINGLTIKQYVPNSNPQERVCKLKYRPFNHSALANFDIKQVSADIEEGIKLFEFRYPHYFRFDRGPWTSISSTSDLDANGDIKLYAKGGSGDNKFILVNFGTSSQLKEFPPEDEEIFLHIEGQFTREVKNKGKAILQFDDGEETPLKPYFQRILNYDNAAGTYTDVADKTASPAEDEITILQTTDDALIIIAPERFWGMKFRFQTPFADATLEIKYSVGGENWSATMNDANNGLEDNTNGFSQDGDITWQSANGWRPNTLIIDSSTFYQGYMIRIKKTSSTGTCKVDEIRRIIRCRGKNNDFLDLYVNLSNLSIQETEEDIIIKEDPNWVAGTWYQNVAIKTIVRDALQRANYYDTDQAIDEIRFALTNPTLNIFGRPPKYNYSKKPGALFIDTDYIYIGIGNELWRLKEDGLFEFLAEFITTPIEEIKYQEIIRIEKSGNIIYSLVRGRYDTYSRGRETVFAECRYDLSSGQIEQDILSGASGECSFRSGLVVANYPDSGYKRAIGIEAVNPTDLEGENIVFPFKQFITAAETNNDYNFYLTLGLFEQDDNSFTIIENTGNGRKSASYYKTRTGYAHLESEPKSNESDLPPIGLRFTLGQMGCILWYETANTFIFPTSLDGLNPFWFLTNATQSIVYAKFFKEYQLPMAGFIDVNMIYLAQTIWWDKDQEKSPTYLSKYAITGKARDWQKVFFQDNAGGSYTEITNAMNNNSGNQTVDQNDIIYLGSDKPFTAAEILRSASDLVADFQIEYWNGSAWAQPDQDDDILGLTGIIQWGMPFDWAKDSFDNIMGTSLDSTDRYWARINVTNYTSGSLTMTGLYNKWTALWDSIHDNSGDYDTCSILWMVKNPNENTIHGSMFERDENAVHGFEFIYFVFDLANETLYVSQYGDNFTFNPNLLIKDLTYNPDDQKIYGVFEDIRYQESAAFLFSANFSGGTINIHKETDLIVGEWGSSCRLAIKDDGTVFGVSKGKKYYLWQYGTDFYPRLLLADFNDLTFREILAEAAKIINQIVTILSERKILFYERTSYNGEKSLKEFAHIVDIKPIRKWQHVYDGIEVEWKDPFSEDDGTEAQGSFGWRRKILNINSKFIQNRFLAQIVAQKYLSYFSQQREEMESEVVALIQTEERDRVKLIANSRNYDIDCDQYWILHDIEFDPDHLIIKLKGIS